MVDMPRVLRNKFFVHEDDHHFTERLQLLMGK